MIAEQLIDDIDYDESGDGPTVVFVPGSCSTGAAWRPVISALNGHFHCVTTSLLGYGGTTERRTTRDPSISHEAEVIEAVIRRTGGPVHLVGHSFGGLASLAVALRGKVRLQSLTVMEAPAVNILREIGEYRHYRTFREMSDVYFAAFRGGNREAISAMVDFYGGPGTFASWPSRVRAYAMETTHVNILDWASAYAFPLFPSELAGVNIPVMILRGGQSHPAVKRANELLSIYIKGASLVTTEGASHFMILTHAEASARAITDHITRIQ